MRKNGWGKIVFASFLKRFVCGIKSIRSILYCKNIDQLSESHCGELVIPRRIKFHPSSRVRTKAMRFDTISGYSSKKSVSNHLLNWSTVWLARSDLSLSLEARLTWGVFKTSRLPADCRLRSRRPLWSLPKTALSEKQELLKFSYWLFVAFVFSDYAL